MKIKLTGAKKGHSLLKKKADALTMRMRSLLKQIMDVRAAPPAPAAKRGNRAAPLLGSREPHGDWLAGPRLGWASGLRSGAGGSAALGRLACSCHAARIQRAAPSLSASAQSATSASKVSPAEVGSGGLACPAPSRTR